jgi:hypothetical protein
MTARYIAALTQRFHEIREVWLIGSRADSSASVSSDWDYIVFAAPDVLRALAADSTPNEPGVDLLVVYGGDEFQAPWANGDRIKHGSLSCWGWTETSEGRAVYTATKPKEDDDFYVLSKKGPGVRVHPPCETRQDTTMQ